MFLLQKLFLLRVVQKPIILFLILRFATLGVKRIITSKIEHHAVLYTLNKLHEVFGVKLEYVDLDDCGRVDLRHLEELLKLPKKRLW